MQFITDLNREETIGVRKDTSIEERGRRDDFVGVGLPTKDRV